MSFLFNNTQGFVVGLFTLVIAGAQGFVVDLFTLVIAGAMMAYVFLRKNKAEVAMMTPALLTSSSLTESTSSQPDGERKEESDLYEGKYHEQTTNSDTEEVVVSAALLRIVKHGYSLSWFKHWIFPYLGLKQQDIIQLRSYCKLFRDALNPPPLWASFPNSKYTSLDGFMNKLNSVYEKDPTKAPKIVFVMEGTFHGNNSVVNINYPLMMIGAGQNQTFLDGFNCLYIGGTQEEGQRVNMQDFTMKGSSGRGLYANNGLSFLCDSMNFTQCRYSGVVAVNTKGRLINCVITQCRLSGIYCRGNALIELEGDQTKVDGNVTCGCSIDYGLHAYDTHRP